MALVLKRPAARRDVIDHFVYLEEHAGLKIADRFLTAADKTFEMIALHPQSGAPQKTNHLPGGIDVVRVIHAARDLERIIAEGFLPK